MQALSAASRCSCGLANRFVPPSSHGSSMSIENRRGTRSPPISKPSICARLRAWPCQVVVTRQFVLPFAAFRLTPSIRANRSSTLIPLTIRATVFVWVWVAMTGSLVCMMIGGTMDLVERGKRRLDALALTLRKQVGKHLAEVRVLGARMDILPPVSLEESGLDRASFRLVNRAAAPAREIAGIGF